MNSAPLAIIETLGTGGAFDGVLSVYSEKKDPVGRQHALDCETQSHTVQRLSSTIFTRLFVCLSVRPSAW